MDHPTFWRLIARIDGNALRHGDDESAVEPLVDALSDCTEDEIRGFEDILAASLYQLDGQTYADAAGQSGRSGDGFLYARCYVVARGETHYESVKANPAEMPDSLDEWCEPLLYVAQRAWARSTGNDEEEWDYQPPLNYETGSNRSNWSS